MWRLYPSARWRRFIRLCQRGSPDQAHVALPLPPLPTRLSAVQTSEREKKESQCRSVLSDGVPENIPRINSHEILEKRKKNYLHLQIRTEPVQEMFCMRSTVSWLFFLSSLDHLCTRSECPNYCDRCWKKKKKSSLQTTPEENNGWVGGFLTESPSLCHYKVKASSFQGLFLA